MADTNAPIVDAERSDRFDLQRPLYSWQRRERLHERDIEMPRDQGEVGNVVCDDGCAEFAGGGGDQHVVQERPLVEKGAMRPSACVRPCRDVQLAPKCSNSA